LTDLTECRPVIRLPSIQRANWLSFASGPFGYWCISIVDDSRVRVEAYLDTGDGETNKPRCAGSGRRPPPAPSSHQRFGSALVIFRNRP